MSAESAIKNQAIAHSTETSLESTDKKNNESQLEIAKVESDEDVPGDFFDDFLKEDFMAGLDIVDDDAWEEDKLKTHKESKNAQSEENVDVPKDKGSIDLKQKNKRKTCNSISPPSREKDKFRDKRIKVKSKRQVEKEDDTKRRNSFSKPVEVRHDSGKQINADEFDIRRDPEKTKRDIQRDKVRCEKDKEMKLISEKLSLVETGLVPPGMEMEIDLDEIKKQKDRITENKSPRDLRERIKDLKERNVRTSPNFRARSPIRKRSISQRSPGLQSKLSPIRRRERSPRRDSAILRPRSPRRRFSSRPRSSEREFTRRRSRSHSPLFYRNRRIRYSPKRRRNRSSSRESEREKWMKHRNRSRSPRQKKEEKKSFLQEIAEKLNETRRESVNVLPLQQMPSNLRYIQPQPMPAPVPAPVPVPAPNNFPIFPHAQQKPMYDPYDQNFFIGSMNTGMTNNFSCQSEVSPHAMAPHLSANPVSIQPLKPPHSVLNNGTINIPQVREMMSTPKNQEEFSKLFQDKQITLSEFLAITAKPQVLSSNPTQLQEKIKVLTRCHDAIKILKTKEKKYSGKLAVYRTFEKEKPPSMFVSPVRRGVSVQFAYTNQQLQSREMKTTTFVHELLQQLGLYKKPLPMPVPDVEVYESDIEFKKNLCPPSPPVISSEMSSNVLEEIPETYSKLVQTDVFKCEECERRKRILSRTVAVQCDAPPATFSVSTQVKEEDVQPKVAKLQSLASLTPAQLLAKSRESLQAISRSNRVPEQEDVHLNMYNRMNFYREGYGASRPNVPKIAGGGRGRMMDSQAIRFPHNYY